jgi:hypothetical protein
MGNLNETIQCEYQRALVVLSDESNYSSLDESVGEEIKRLLSALSRRMTLLPEDPFSLCNVVWKEKLRYKNEKNFEAIEDKAKHILVKGLGIQVSLLLIGGREHELILDTVTP